MLMLSRWKQLPFFLKSCVSRLHVKISEEECRQVLDKFNTWGTDDLDHLSALSSHKIQQIVQHRAEHGHFRQMSDLLDVQGLGQKTLNRILAEMLNKDQDSDLLKVAGSRRNKAAYILDKTVINPRLAMDELPESVLSCGLQLNTVYWLRMRKDLTVTDWQCKQFVDRKRQKYDHARYQERLHEVVEIMPDAGLCLMEDTPILVSNLGKVSGALNLARAEAILTTLLTIRASTPSQPFEHRVYRLKSTAISNYFDLLVGGQRTSAQSIVYNISRGQNEKAAGVVIPVELNHAFYHLTGLHNEENHRVIKEQMSYCLLQATMFYKLLLLQAADHDDDDELFHSESDDCV